MKKRNCGFTLLEVIISIVILAALAGLAFPRYETMIEKARAVEGVKMLGAIYRAQQAHYLMAGGSYANNMKDLMLEEPAMKFFNNVLISDGTGEYGLVGVVGRVGRKNGLYILSISASGAIKCLPIAEVGKVGELCKQLGFKNAGEDGEDGGDGGAEGLGAEGGGRSGPASPSR